MFMDGCRELETTCPVCGLVKESSLSSCISEPCEECKREIEKWENEGGV